METSTTTGSGTLTLAGAVTGFRTFTSVYATGIPLYYCIEGVDGSGNPTGEWEEGWGSLASSTTLSRTRVIASSNAGSVVTLSAGTKRVFITAPAAQMQAKGHDVARSMGWANY